MIKETILDLFRKYQFENSRINKGDADITKEFIRDELDRRIKKSIALLENAETEEEAIRIYNQFIEF